MYSCVSFSFTLLHTYTYICTYIYIKLVVVGCCCWNSGLTTTTIRKSGQRSMVVSLNACLVENRWWFSCVLRHGVKSVSIGEQMCPNARDGQLGPSINLFIILCYTTYYYFIYFFFFTVKIPWELLIINGMVLMKVARLNGRFLNFYVMS